MTDPTQLSPAAQAVWDAAWQLSPVNCGSHEDRRRQQIAAALCAAADQAELVHPVKPSAEWGEGWLEGVQDVVAGFRRIAAELENTNDHELPPSQYARAVLASWGNPALQPVPTSERLPEPKDCDAERRCWVWWKNGVRWVLDEWTHHELKEGPLSGYISHWLPAHALPLPTAND